MATTVLRATSLPGPPQTFVAKAAPVSQKLDVAVSDATVTTLTVNATYILSAAASDASVTAIAITEATRA
jgi:hypothetical protein